MDRKHDDVIKWKHFPRYWPFKRGIHRSPVNYPHKGQWRGALMFSLICVWINGWVNNGEAGDLRRYRAYYDVTVMKNINIKPCWIIQQANAFMLNRAGSRFAPSQWEAALLCNDVSHWLNASLESDLLNTWLRQKTWTRVWPNVTSKVGHDLRYRPSTL